MFEGSKRDAGHHHEPSGGASPPLLDFGALNGAVNVWLAGARSGRDRLVRRAVAVESLSLGQSGPPWELSLMAPPANTDGNVCFVYWSYVPSIVDRERR